MNRKLISFLFVLSVSSTALRAQGPIIVKEETAITNTNAKTAITASPEASGGGEAIIKKYSIGTSLFAVSAGYVLLNPYKIENGVLEQNGTDGAGFIEFGLFDVWAWDPQARY